MTQKILLLMVGQFLLFTNFSIAQESALGSSGAAGVAGQEVTLSVPFYSSEFSPGAPHGFEAEHVRPTYDLRAMIRTQDHSSIGGWFGAEVNFTRFTLVPMLMASGGIQFGAPSGIGVDLGLVSRFQGLIEQDPFERSQYDVIGLGAVARLRVPFSSFVAGAEIKYIDYLNQVISEEEGFETVLGHSPTWKISPHLSVKLPLGLLGRAGVDLYWLGATAAASRQFAFGNERDQVTRYDLALGKELGKFQIWLRGQFVSGVRDAEELYFLAPSFGGEYLLSSRVFRLELTWSN